MVISAGENQALAVAWKRSDNLGDCQLVAKALLMVVTEVLA